jgi:hypothetical protein
MDQEKRSRWLRLLRVNAIVVFYLLKFLLVLIYSDPEIQPFVYVRF